MPHSRVWSADHTGSYAIGCMMAIHVALRDFNSSVQGRNAHLQHKRSAVRRDEPMNPSTPDSLERFLSHR